MLVNVLYTLKAQVFNLNCKSYNNNKHIDLNHIYFPEDIHLNACAASNLGKRNLTSWIVSS